MQTARYIVTRKVAVHRQTCGSLPRGQGTPSGTLERPQHPQLVPGARQHPQPSLSALPRTHRQTRRLINSHGKLDNYLDIYRQPPPVLTITGTSPTSHQPVLTIQGTLPRFSNRLLGICRSHETACRLSP
jgi:hypothetical protein